MSEPVAGDRLDQYELEELLARSGMAAIFKARDTFTGATVALKIPHFQYESDVVFSERFRREEEVGQKLDHPNVVRILKRIPKCYYPRQPEMGMNDVVIDDGGCQQDCTCNVVPRQAGEAKHNSRDHADAHGLSEIGLLYDQADNRKHNQSKGKQAPDRLRYFAFMFMQIGRDKHEQYQLSNF